MIHRDKQYTALLICPLLFLLAGCPFLLGGRYVGNSSESISITNALSVPICKITIASTSDPAATIDHRKDNSSVLLPGAKDNLLYNKASDGNVKYMMTAFSCKKNVFVGEKLMETEIDVSTGSAVIH